MLLTFVIFRATTTLVKQKETYTYLLSSTLQTNKNVNCGNCDEGATSSPLVLSKM